MGMIESSAHLLKEFWLWIVIIAVLIGLVSCTMNSFNLMKITLIDKENVTENVTENITEPEIPHRQTIKEVYFNNTNPPVVFIKTFPKKNATKIKDIYYENGTKR